jgi:hypothetical protein
MPQPTAVAFDAAFLVMDLADNVAVARRLVPAGTVIALAGERVTLAVDVPTGHKVARRFIRAGEPVIRWHAPIGSATADIPACGHVHLHNMKSDYIPTYLAGDTTHGSEDDA